MSGTNVENNVPTLGNINDLRRYNTQRGHSTALKAFDRFVSESVGTYPHLKKSDNLTLDDLRGEEGRTLVNLFGKWLLNAKTTNNQHYAPSSIPQYVSSWFSHYVGAFPELKNEKELWFDDFHAAIANMARAYAIQSGRPLKKKTKGIRREMCAKLLSYVMKDNDQKSWEKRAVIVLLRLSCGRGGEVSTMTWDTSYWEPEEEVFTVDWSEEKTTKENEMTYGPDHSKWILDGIHSIAAYLVTCPGLACNNRGDSIVSWMFPRLHDMKDGGAAHFASEIIKQCIGHVSLYHPSPRFHHTLIQNNLSTCDYATPLGTPWYPLAPPDTP